MHAQFYVYNYSTNQSSEHRSDLEHISVRTVVAAQPISLVHKNRTAHCLCYSVRSMNKIPAQQH